MLSKLGTRRDRRTRAAALRTAPFASASYASLKNGTILKLQLAAFFKEGSRPLPCDDTRVT
jgi:hypothetical protein